MMTDRSFRQKVIDEYGNECLLCGRSPSDGYDRRQGLSTHHVNGDASDNRLENVIPVCQSCHIHIHRSDTPPYRKWHRQLPLEARNYWNQFTERPYTGPQLSREEAERRFGDAGGTPRGTRYFDADDERGP